MTSLYSSTIRSWRTSPLGLPRRSARAESDGTVSERSEPVSTFSTGLVAHETVFSRRDKAAEFGQWETYPARDGQGSLFLVPSH